ncbi:GTPase HflX [Methyloferula stellata]|uniref:GTPase HflX n=1 Tax=Methyloferula stellata TaxID=876270 RepID=UPI00037C2975|nr:GTPase HflX [Methyloferula stellata]
MSRRRDAETPTDLEQARAKATRALVIGPYLSQRAQQHRDRTKPAASATAAAKSAAEPARSLEARIAEASGLAEAIELFVVAAKIITLNEIKPATFLGRGKVAELATFVEDEAIDLVIMDCALSPIQQRNLEKALSAKVIDRTGLILEIFGQRARTKEGALQVELAHLSYEKSRLVRSWTHLERQRGGFGFLGGPGETQIETDRRLLSERMARIERDLEDVKRTRALHRKGRRDVPFPVVALVGYTNAGKSTLFNRLTQAKVVAEDMLFATLDPTLRRLRLPHGADVILSDTVGFISDLPTQLVSAFRATLEEVIEADIILHVRDIAHEDADAQCADVEKVLADLGIARNQGRVIEVWNKLDLLDQGERLQIENSAKRRPAATRPAIISAVTGQGMDDLLASLDAKLASRRLCFNIAIEPDDGSGLNWLYENAEVMQKSMAQDGTLHLTIRVATERADALQRRFPLHAHETPRRKASA